MNLDGHHHYVVDLGDTISEPCETLGEAREVQRLNLGAGPVYRLVWQLVDEE